MWAQLAQMALNEGERRTPEVEGPKEVQAQEIAKDVKTEPSMQDQIKNMNNNQAPVETNKFQLGENMENKVEQQPQANEGGTNAKDIIGGIANLAQSENNQPQMIGYTPIAQSQNIASDERLKDVLSEGADPVDLFAQIDSFLYKYKPEAIEVYGETGKVNDKENFGVMAQDLAENPITNAAVEKDENGYLSLNSGRLSSINTAMISELCKRIEDLESAVYGRK